MPGKDQVAHDLALIAVQQMVEITRARYSVANMQGEDGFGLLTEDVMNYYTVAYGQILKNLPKQE